MTITKHAQNVALDAQVLNAPYLEVEFAKTKASLTSPTIEHNLSNLDILIGDSRVTGAFIYTGVNYATYNFGDVRYDEQSDGLYIFKLDGMPQSIERQQYDDSWLSVVDALPAYVYVERT